MKKNNNLKIFVILAIILFIIIFLFLFIYNRYSIVGVEHRNMSISIIDENIVGFNVNSDALYFDKVVSGGTGKRIVYLENNFPFDVNVEISTKGDITHMITVSDNDFVLEPSEKIEIIYYANTGSTPIGNYTGTTTVVFRRKFV